MSCVKALTNGAPLILFHNTNDLSDTDLPVASIPRPQHMPVFILQTERGPTGPQAVDGKMRELLYGDASFSETGIYTNHQTIGSNLAASAANAQIIYRVTNGTRANMTLYAEVTAMDIDLFERDTDGKYVLDATTGSLIQTGTQVAGHTIRWLVGTESTFTETGTKSTTTATVAGNTVTTYPIMDFVVDNPGAFGNNIGIRLYADTTSGAIDLTEMNSNKAFPYQFMMVERSAYGNTPSITRTLTGERTVTVTFSPNSTNRLSLSDSRYVKDVIDARYDNRTDTRYRLAYSPFGQNTYVYQNNINTIATAVSADEIAYLLANPTAVTDLDIDLLQSAGGSHLMNLISATDSGNVPHYTLVLDEAATPGASVRLTQFTTIYAQNGADNIMSTKDYETAVSEVIARYADCQDEVQDIARRPESIFYDTGFTLDTKLNLVDFISQRPDLNLVYSTHTDDRQVRGYVWDNVGTQPDPGSSVALSMADEITLSTTLQNRARLIPESDYFGTPTSRVIIFAGSGVIRNSAWTARVPVTMEMLYKASKYMGASNGRWNSSERFSRAPGSIMQILKDVTIPWIPADVRVRNWDVGINMALAYNENFVSMPTQQTVYPDDTSILNQWLPTLAIAYLNKVAHAAWREFRGVDDLEPGELVTAVGTFINDQINGIWDNRYLVIPDATVTSDDELRGTTWHLNVKFGASNARTTEIVSISAYRKADLEAQVGA